eukprot:TRINITY_DN7790_c0_g1_i2.p1 TRINITY_DN7790_c0_g1~~TRINITY_DN7790_c0_g1_i2.p1  ORF type:complete len:441 (+),score=106.87 TRINITY_DN7790_c0_g1_i2:184-1323(+)
MPFANGPSRIIAVLGIWAMHVGFGACLLLGMFAWVPGVVSLIFLPSFFWETVVPFVRAHIPLSRHVSRNLTLTVYTKGESMWMAATTFCMFFVWGRYQIIDASQAETRDPAPAYASPDRADIALDMKAPPVLDPTQSFGVEYEGKRGLSSGYGGFVSLVEASCLWFVAPLLRRARFASVAQYMTRLTQALEKQHTVFSSWVYPTTPRKVKQYLVVELVILFFVLYILNWNFASFYKYPVNPDIFWIGPTFKIDQYWGMFAPHPPKDSSYFVIHGVTAGGEAVNVFREGEPVTTEKPPLMSQLLPSQRWRQWLQNMPDSRLVQNRLNYGRYLCREWNYWGRHPGDQQLKEFKITWFRSPIRLDGGEVETQSFVIWEHTCF